MTDSPGLERGYRRLLACYPRAFRRQHAEEVLAVLMASAPEGQKRPRLGAAAGGVRTAAEKRAGPPRVTPVRPAVFAAGEHPNRGAAVPVPARYPEFVLRAGLRPPS